MLSGLSMRRAVPKTESEVFLGIDLGSSGVKAILLSPAAGIVASKSVAVPLYSDHAGWAEADPFEWWSAVCAIIPQLLISANRVSSNIKGVAVSGMVPAVVLIDVEGKPLRRAMLQNDARAVQEIDYLKNALAGVDLLVLTGSVMSQQSVAPSLLWIAKNEPLIFKDTRAILGSYDWLATKLGASWHVESNWALESGLYSVELDPLEIIQKVTKLNWPQLLEVKHPGDQVGVVSASAAIESGLSRGTPIYVGGADHVLSAFGAGLIEQGDCLIKLGGAGDILVVSDSIHLDSRLYLDKHPAPGKWMPNGCMATSGSLLRWEQSLFGGESLEQLDSEARTSKPAMLLTLPYFLGEKTPLHDPNLRGAMVGMHLGTTRGDIHRSYLEAIAYGFKAHFEVFAEGNLEISRVTVTNGGSKSKLWRTILADVLERELHSIIQHPGASYGSAVIAGIGYGSISDWSYVLKALEPGEIIYPNLDNVAIYKNRYQDFKEFGAAVAPISHRLARG